MRALASINDFSDFDSARTGIGATGVVVVVVPVGRATGAKVGTGAGVGIVIAAGFKEAGISGVGGSATRDSRWGRQI